MLSLRRYPSWLRRCRSPAAANGLIYDGNTSYIIILIRHKAAAFPSSPAHQDTQVAWTSLINQMLLPTASFGGPNNAQSLDHRRQQLFCRSSFSAVPHMPEQRLTFSSVVAHGRSRSSESTGHCTEGPIAPSSTIVVTPTTPWLWFGHRRIGTSIVRIGSTGLQRRQKVDQSALNNR
jgi:hypothetical protein